MKKITIPSNVKNGKLVQNRNLIQKAIASFEDTNINITIERLSKKRSVQQNAFYWGVWIPIIQQAINDTWGEFYPPNEVHNVLKALCNYEERPNPATGEIQRVPVSSTKLSTYEWEKEFKQQVRQMCMDNFNLDLPEPDNEE